MSEPLWLDAAGFPMTAAITAIEQALLDGLDPAADAPRSTIDWSPAGHLLFMPSLTGGYAGTKLATVANSASPRIKGVYVLWDTEALAPLALMDAAALTLLRTPALSAVAARRLAAPGARRLVVFGAGPQARAHEEALRAVLPGLTETTYIRRGDDTAAVAEADVVCCCTSAREPLFDSALVQDTTTVIAMGSHEPDARELDTDLMRRATVVVESRATALHEAGDVMQAGLEAADLITIDALVRDEARPPAAGPRVFKSAGMSWEDLVVAAAVWEGRDRLSQGGANGVR